MLVVHALFGSDDGELIFWAEADEATAWRPTLPDGPDGGVPLHPFGATPAALRRALEGGGLGIQPLTAGTATVLLPSDADGPRASGEPAAAVATAAWRVGGLRVPLGPTVRWLTTVATAETKSTPLEARMLATAVGVSSLGSVGTTAVAEQPELSLGSDVRYWARAAAFALELLADEQVVPELVRRADGDYTAVWRPLLTGQAERRCFRALAEAMPPACRALGMPGEPVPASELLRDFLGSAIDSLARGWLAESVWPEARWLLREGTGMPAAAGRWLEALGAARASSARLSARRASELAREVTAWTEALVGASAPFRLCLRLTPPTGAPARRVPNTVAPSDLVGAANIGVPAAGAVTPGSVSRVSTAGRSKKPIHALGTTSDARDKRQRRALAPGVPPPGRR